MDFKNGLMNIKTAGYNGTCTIYITSVKIIVSSNFSLSLPDKIKVTDIKWLSVWGRHFQYNFGNILMPEDLSIGYVDPTVLTCPEHEDNEVDSNLTQHEKFTNFFSKTWI